MERATLDYAALFDGSPNPYLVLDRSLNIVDANRAYLAATNRDLADLVGRWAWDAFPTDPETLRLTIDSFERVMRTKAPVTLPLLRFDIPRPQSQGGGFEERYWSIIASPILDAHGEVEALLQHPIDVTELEHLREVARSASPGQPIELAREHSGIFQRARSVQEANLALQAEAARLRDLFAKAPGFMATLRGPQHHFEFINDAYRRLVGDRDLIGLPVREALTEVEGQGFFELLDSVYTTGEPFVGRGVEVDVQQSPQGPKQRRYVDFVYQPIRDYHGHVSGIFVEGSDVTDARLAADGLRAQEERIRLVIEGARDHAILTTDPEGIVTSWSPGAEASFGWTTGQAIGLPISVIYTQEDREQAVDVAELEIAKRDGRANDERWHVRKDGQRVFMNGSVHPLPRNAAGQEQGFIKIARDETESRQTAEALRQLNETLEAQVAERTEALLASEESLRQSQKLDAIGQLTGGVAHDFNNLLTIIRGSVDLLLRPNLPEEKRQRYIQAIADTTTRATKLTSQLLAFARRQALRPETFNASKAVLAVNDMLGTLAGSRIMVEAFAPHPLFISADPSQFDTALVNMAVNARDAMTGEGRLTISVYAADAIPAVRNHAAMPGPFVAVSLTDTGSGIQADRFDQIFEPFFTTKEVGKGTGLGLSQVFGFAKQSGGEVTVISEPGQGATFTLYLPRVADPGDVPSTDALPPPIDGKGARVLVVEDNAEVGRFAVTALQALGYDPILAENAEVALKQLAAADADIRVVFSDVVMPGMNGIELGREVRRLYPGLPVLLASGYSHVLTDGTHGFDLLDKPYSVDRLSQMLRKATRSQETSARPS